MPRKKRFNKNNSQKFLLLHGNDRAVNADGKTLENVFVPVSQNYKPGSSLLMSGIAALCNAEPTEDAEEEADLKKIIAALDDSDSEITVEHLPSEMKRLNVSEKVSNCDRDDFFDNFAEEGQFSDASDDFFQSQSEDECDGNLIDSNCPEAVKMFNAKFNKVLKEYKDDQIGALDDDDDDEIVASDGLSLSTKHFIDSFCAEDDDEKKPTVLQKCDENMKQKILNYAEDSTDEEMVEVVIEKPLEYDCESILSTYSNKYNHPTVIYEEKTNKKVQKIRVPNNPLKKKLTKSQLKTLSSEKDDSSSESEDNVSVSTAFNVRVKGETTEQKRERKKLFKEAKRESRMLKKENKLAFKEEKKVQRSRQINAQHTAAVRLL